MVAVDFFMCTYGKSADTSLAKDLLLRYLCNKKEKKKVFGMKAGKIIFIVGGLLMIFLGFLSVLLTEYLIPLFVFSVSVTIGIILIGIPFLFDQNKNT